MSITLEVIMYIYYRYIFARKFNLCTFYFKKYELFDTQSFIQLLNFIIE